MSINKNLYIPDPVDVVVWYNKEHENSVELENAFIQKCKCTGKVFDVYGEDNLRTMYREYRKYMNIKRIEDKLNSLIIY